MNTIKHLALTILATTLALACSGDEFQPDEPRLDLRKGPAFGDAEALYSELDDTCKPTLTVSEGEVFHLLHVLPPKIGDNVPDDGKLEVEVRTACGAETLTLTHDSYGVVTAPIEAPAGAECGVRVVATIANSTTSCILEPVSEDTCMATCPEPTAESEDAGTETGGTETGGTETGGTETG